MFASCLHQSPRSRIRRFSDGRPKLIIIFFKVKPCLGCIVVALTTFTLRNTVIYRLLLRVKRKKYSGKFPPEKRACVLTIRIVAFNLSVNCSYCSTYQISTKISRMESVSSATPETKSEIPRGTDPEAIATRLKAFYDNLDASSPRHVKTIISQNNTIKWHYGNESPVARGDLDANNNTTIQTLPEPKLPGHAEQQQQPKIKYELPVDYQGVTNCTCLRKQRTYECGFCHHYFQGRLSQICEKHPSEVFLMDLRQCPYCMAQLEMIKESPLSWEDVRKIEDADLPSDTDI